VQCVQDVLYTMCYIHVRDNLLQQCLNSGIIIISTFNLVIITITKTFDARSALNFGSFSSSFIYSL